MQYWTSPLRIRHIKNIISHIFSLLKYTFPLNLWILQAVDNIHVSSTEGKWTHHVPLRSRSTNEEMWQHVIAINTYELSPRISFVESSSPGAFVSSCFLIRKNRTVPTRLITVRAMKTVLRSLSVEKQTRAITRCAEEIQSNPATFKQLTQTCYGV